MVKRHLFLILAALAVSGMFGLPVAADDTPTTAQEVSSPTAEVSDSAVAQDALYKLQPEDVLQVDVWGEPMLQRLQLQVTPDGHISVAYVGSIDVAGLTAQEVSAVIAKRLVDDEILKNPKVQVTVITVHRLQVRVLGQVNRPGMIELKDGDTVLEAVAQAGSFTDNAFLEGSTITRSGDKMESLDLKALFFKGNLSQNYVLKKGDVIYIPENTTNFFYVMGEVNRPGQYQLKDNTTILSAIMQASGQTDRAALKSTVLVRGDYKSPERIPVNMTAMIKNADMTQNIQIQAGDVVYVPETSKPDLNKIGQILNIISNLGVIRRYGLF